MSLDILLWAAAAVGVLLLCLPPRLHTRLVQAGCVAVRLVTVVGVGALTLLSVGADAPPILQSLLVHSWTAGLLDTQQHPLSPSLLAVALSVVGCVLAVALDFAHALLWQRSEMRGLALLLRQQRLTTLAGRAVPQSGPESRGTPMAGDTFPGSEPSGGKRRLGDIFVPQS
jgi:hypothetical protein